MFIRKSAEAFIYSVFFLSCATITRSAMLIKCSKKNIIFRKSAAALFLLFDAKAIRGDALSIKCDRILCFSKDRQGVYFCPTYIEGCVLSRIYGLDSICQFYCIYICCQFVLHLSALLHLWSIITFVASKVKTNVALFSRFCLWVDVLKKPIISERF